MMKYFVISDIHGDAESCKKALDLYDKSDCDALLILGDILYHGPRNDLPKGYDPKAVIKLLNPLADQIIAVKGNCDGEVDQMVLNFPILSICNQFYIKNRKVLMSHGHTITPNSLPPLPQKSVFLYGHTHILKAQEIDGIYHCNPGSISMPKGGFPQSFAILDETGFSIISLNDRSDLAAVFF